MGKAIIHVDPNVLITSLLQLSTYEVVQTKVESLYAGGREVLTFEVESSELPDEPTEQHIEPVYESLHDEQGRTWYRLVGIDTHKD